MRRLLVWRPARGGVAGALLFFAASFVPSLLPRPWYVQGSVAGLALALGYGAGSAVGALVGTIVRAMGGRTSGRALGGKRSGRALGGKVSPTWGRWTATVVAGGIAVSAIVVHHRWQVDVRRLMGMDPGVGVYLAGAVAIAPVVGYVLVVAVRLARTAFRAYRRVLGGVMPRGIALPVALASVVVVTVVFFDVVVAGRLLPALEGAYRASDQRFDPDVAPPSSPMMTGGPGSIVEWETMGRQGRAFVSQAPDRSELEAFSGRQAPEPIRIYVGLQSAEGARARANLAVAEMERTGAFSRAAIVLIVPTGSGWIDPFAVDALEFMHNGDTAAVAIQYSYLASWMVMVGNQDLAIEAAEALFEAVRDRIDEEPPAIRPDLLLYGESLGAFGFERLFDDVEQVRRSTDGALWVGPPRSGPLWQRLVARRDPGSPVWRPVYQGGEAVRFGPDGAALALPQGDWTRPRIVYLQHASDPITWWTPGLLFERPEWMDPPRGPDVSSRMPYVPVVTFWQMAVDLAMGTNAPLGHGHKFGIAQAEAWALIAPPEGWSSDDTARLVAAVDR